MANSTYTEADYLEDCKTIDEQPAKPAPANFTQFVAKCMDSGLSAKFYHETHWQIQKAGKALVDFWPTANKVRPCQCKNKEKARKGNAADAIALASMLAAGSKPKAKNDDPRLRRELSARAAMAALISTYCDPDCPFPKPEMIAEESVKYADALIAELDKSEVANG